ncbi:MAG TPA: hypothetical protein DCS21_02655 [Gammaproteobacteria bacterium]|nr:hypothetical protein [Gammaproteobacteria bacterium]
MAMLSVSHSAEMATCVICHAPLSAHQARIAKFCHRADCRWQYALLQKKHQVCRVCGRPLSMQEWTSGICAAPDCRRVAIAQQAHEYHKRQVQREQQLWEQAGQLRQQVLNRFGVGEPDTFQLAVVPAAIHRITRLPASRRREFRDYLKPLTDRAVALPAIPVVEPDSTMESASMQETRLSAASGSACACCQGYCCRGGAYTHAYLGVETLQRYVAARPDQPPDQILAAYLRYIGKETSEGSCVYQRADGCSLPREMRATICNNFYCGGLREFRAKVPATGPVRGFFVAMTDNEICRAALVDEEQMLMMSAPPAPRD